MMIRSWEQLAFFFSPLQELERDCFASTAWSPETWEKLFKNRELFVRLELQHESLIGYAVVSKAADESELLRLGVKKEFRGRGIGKRLLKQSSQEAEKTGSKLLFLEVRADNESAIRFYRHFGFKEVGRRRDYYADPGCDALLFLFQFTTS